MMSIYMITLQGNKNSETYAEKRQPAYKGITDQLDILYHDIDAGRLGTTAKTSYFYLHRKSIKDKYPKS
tara:strand:- start:306 stop:512 length:207 start_codon:yes stop_codon:yes gene_type:complete